MDAASLLNRVTIEPGKCAGKPCIRGMRFPVSDLLEMLGNGMTQEQIIGDHPDIQPEDILAALLYAARNVNRVA